MIRRPPRSTQSRSSAASDVYKRQLDVDVLGVTAGHADGAEGKVEDRSTHVVRLDDQDVGAFLSDATGELLGAVDPDRLVLDPRIEAHVGDRLERLEALAAKRCEHERSRSGP